MPYDFATRSGESPASIMPQTERVGIRVPLMHGAPNCTSGLSMTPASGSHETAKPVSSLNNNPLTGVTYSRSRSSAACPCRLPDTRRSAHSANRSPWPVHRNSVANGHLTPRVSRSHCSVFRISRQGTPDARLRRTAGSPARSHATRTDSASRSPQMAVASKVVPNNGNHHLDARIVYSASKTINNGSNLYSHIDRDLGFRGVSFRW